MCNKKIAKLFDIIARYYDKYNSGNYERYRREGRATYCNMFVNDICKQFGYGAFQGKVANQMAEIIDNNISSGGLMINDFHTIYDMHFAQEQANNGNLVIAYNYGREHGHINVLRPGTVQFSNKWSRNVPMCVNIGKTNFIGKGLNWAFGSMPKMAILLKSL